MLEGYRLVTDSLRWHTKHGFTSHVFYLALYMPGTTWALLTTVCVCGLGACAVHFHPQKSTNLVRMELQAHIQQHHHMLAGYTDFITRRAHVLLSLVRGHASPDGHILAHEFDRLALQLRPAAHSHPESPPSAHDGAGPMDLSPPLPQPGVQLSLWAIVLSGSTTVGPDGLSYRFMLCYPTQCVPAYQGSIVPVPVPMPCMLLALLIKHQCTYCIMTFIELFGLLTKATKYWGTNWPWNWAQGWPGGSADEPCKSVRMSLMALCTSVFRLSLLPNDSRVNARHPLLQHWLSSPSSA